MKRIGLPAVIICIVIVILTGCNKSNIPSISEVSKNLQGESMTISPVNLDTEEDIIEYLVGEWIFDKKYISDVICKMNIDENLNLQLSFWNSSTDERIGYYEGEIVLDKLYAKPDEAPDLISIELIETDYPGGGFFFLHRTFYDGKRVMSLFFAGNGNSVFDIYLGPEDYAHAPEEIVFEKESGEISQIRPRKNEKFYAVFWGKGGNRKSFWLDDVLWTPPGEDNFATVYPRPMILYENDRTESVLYSIKSDRIGDILGEDFFPGQVYYVETDGNGSIVEIIDAEYKKFLEEIKNDYAKHEIEDLIIDITNDILEIQEYLDDGMTILFTGEITLIDGEECYEVALGTSHKEAFVREIHYAVNIVTRQVYKYDILNDTWETIGVG